MNGGTSNGAAPAGNGILSQITSALDIIYGQYSTNQSRHEAQSFLEGLKTLDEAPQHGFTLASDKSQPPQLRHYGLSLLEHAVKHKWTRYSSEQAQYLRNWIIQLAQNVSKDDPPYVRSKIAQLWVELVGRCWGLDWSDMDELLVRMWQVPDLAVHKEVVLHILETLSVEIFEGDSAIFSIRERELGQAAVEIFTPAKVQAEIKHSRGPEAALRCGEEGWLMRIGQLLEECLNGDLNNEDIRACAIRCLKVYATVMVWVNPLAVSATQCVGHMCRGLAAPHVAVQREALEGLHALYSRQNFSDDAFTELVLPMYDTEFVNLCGRLFEWCTVDASDVDDDKYQFAKKFSEMVACIGQYLPRKFSCIPSDTPWKEFLRLLLLIVQSQSLLVSIPVLVTWTKLLAHQSIGSTIVNTEFVAPLLEVCSSRLIRYESLPEDTEDPTLMLLLEDTDTIPERHAFLGNYRRYSSQVIEAIVQLKLSDAFYHILRQAQAVLDAPNGGLAPLDPANYSKNSMPVLRVDAHFTVIESALKGYMKWRRGETGRKDTGQGADPAQDLQVRASMEKDFEQWCDRLLQMELQDPMIRKRRLQLLVAFSTTALHKNADFMLKVLGHILATWPAPVPEHKALNEAIKELQSESIVELQRLTLKMPDHLLTVYGDLESRIQEMVASGSLDEKRQIAYQGFLFTITHRASQLDENTRIQRLRTFVEPVQAQWANENLQRALASYNGFCELVCLDKAQSYLARHRVHEISDWGAVPLDDEGRALQKEMEDRQAALPLRPTKAFLNHSVERIDKLSPAYQASVAIWKDAFPMILTELLQFLDHAHAAYNPANWTLMGPELQSVVPLVLTDRFWQAGISEGTRDEFYARVMDKKNTLEGLGSSIRGTVRFVREACYGIIYCMSRLDEQFYGYKELPVPLANALFANASSLSTHQLINLLNLVRYLVDNCPVELRPQFLPPLLSVCFREMDRKISGEWQKLAARAGVQAEGDALTEEMKAESILRQLTYTAIVMVADFLDPARTNPVPAGPEQPVVPAPSLRRFCLMTLEIAEPLLLFCMHTISMRDNRCCGVALRVFRNIVPEFYCDNDETDMGPCIHLVKHDKNEPFRISDQTAHAIREFISSEVVRACIGSLRDPHFVDSQKDIASLIATILVNYTPHTTTPARELQEVEGVYAQDVEQLIDWIGRPGLDTRSQRGIVLEFLRDIKGVSVSQLGTLNTTERKPALRHTKMAQDFMEAVNETRGQPTGARQPTPDMQGVADMFAQDG